MPNVRAGGAFVTISLQDNITGPLRRIQATVQRFGAGLRNIGTLFAIPTIGAGFGFSRIAQQFSEFDDSLRFTRSLLNLSERDFEGLDQTIRRIGATTSFTARQVADASSVLARAGFTTSASIEQALPNILNLSRATRTDLDQTANFVARIGNTFQINDTQRIADTIGFVANNSAQNLTELAFAFDVGGQAAQQAGIPLERTAAIFGVLANNSVVASRAGRGLRQIFQQLFQQGAGEDTGTIDRIRNRFNLEFDDSAASNFNVFLSQLLDRLRDLSRVDRQIILSELFGTISNAPVNIIAQSLDEIIELETRARNAGGFVQRVSSALDEGLGGSGRIALSSLTDLNIAFFRSLSALQPLVDGFSAATRAVTSFIDGNQQLVGRFTFIAATVGILGTSLIAVGLAISAASVAFGGFISLFVTGPFALVTGAIGLLTGAFTPLLALPSLLSSIASGPAALARQLNQTSRQLNGLFSGTSFSGFGRGIQRLLIVVRGTFNRIIRLAIPVAAALGRLGLGAIATGFSGSLPVILATVAAITLLGSIVNQLLQSFFALFDVVELSISSLGSFFSTVRSGISSGLSEISDGFDLFNRNVASGNAGDGARILSNSFQRAFGIAFDEVLSGFVSLLRSMSTIYDVFSDRLATFQNSFTFQAAVFSIQVIENSLNVISDLLDRIVASIISVGNATGSAFSNSIPENLRNFAQFARDFRDSFRTPIVAEISSDQNLLESSPELNPIIRDGRTQSQTVADSRIGSNNQSFGGLNFADPNRETPRAENSFDRLADSFEERIEQRARLRAQSDFQRLFDELTTGVNEFSFALNNATTTTFGISLQSLRNQFVEGLVSTSRDLRGNQLRAISNVVDPVFESLTGLSRASSLADTLVGRIGNFSFRGATPLIAPAVLSPITDTLLRAFSISQVDRLANPLDFTAQQAQPNIGDTLAIQSSFDSGFALARGLGSFSIEANTNEQIIQGLDGIRGVNEQIRDRLPEDGAQLTPPTFGP